jgi:hypothetical protein
VGLQQSQKLGIPSRGVVAKCIIVISGSNLRFISYYTILVHLNGRIPVSSTGGRGSAGLCYTLGVSHPNCSNRSLAGAEDSRISSAAVRLLKRTTAERTGGRGYWIN